MGAQLARQQQNGRRDDGCSAEAVSNLILLILAINAYTTSVLSHDFPGKTIFGLVWLVAFGAALITVILSSELGGTTSRPALVDRSLRRPLRSATRFG